jgi:hypothetical protein
MEVSQQAPSFASSGVATFLSPDHERRDQVRGLECPGKRGHCFRASSSSGGRTCLVGGSHRRSPSIHERRVLRNNNMHQSLDEGVPKAKTVINIAPREVQAPMHD